MTTILGREGQHSSLIAALEGHLPQALLIWGPASTGKTFVLNSVLNQCRIRHIAKISAIEIMCGKRPFFETLLKQLSGDGETKCENIRMFVRQLRILYQHKLAASGKTVIILDKAEYLLGDHAEILEVFVRLQELIQSNLCVVVFSSVVPSLGFSSISGMRNIFSLHFPQYSQDDIVNIITTCHKPETADRELFSAYVGMVVTVFYQGCRDLKKLLRLALSNWESVQRQHSHEQHSLRQMWKNIVPQLKQDFKALNSQFLPMMDNNKTNSACEISSSLIGNGSLNGKPKPSANGKNYNDIPKYSRYILIASYLATHNPPSSDKRFFVKASTRRTGKRTKFNVGAQLEETENANERTKALRSFDQNRLKSIFAFLVSYCSGGTETYEGNVDWLMQISSLCESQFIQHLGEDTSGNMKFRCLADYDFILKISNSVDFELNNHLYRLL